MTPTDRSDDTHSPARLLRPALLFAAVLAGCGSSNANPPTDASTSDVPEDTAPDGGSPSEGSADALEDTATAAATDATADATGANDGGGMTACSALTNPLYVMSGDTQVPILKTLGKTLRQDANPVTLVWQATGSCTIIDAVYNGTLLKQNLSYIPADPAWDPATGTVPTCTPDATGAPVQLGIPIVFPESCTTATPPATVKAFKGPVQSFVFVVPTASTAHAISAEEAYLVFGFGAAGGVTPWTDEAFYFVRPPTKGTQVSLGAVIGVPAAKWKGNAIDQSTGLASMVAASTSPDKTMGILGAEIYDSTTNRAVLRSLSFQGYGQMGGYFPDTTATAFDKRNVRDGHYLGWSHVFYLTAVGTGGSVTDARAGRVIDILTGAPSAAAAGLDPLGLVASKGLIPLCAMAVQRNTEGGPITAFQSEEPCGCYYESNIGAAPASCVACTASATCASGERCSHGFCEAANGRTSISDCAAPATDADIPNIPCTGRSVAAMLPQPQKEIDNGGTLPPLP